MDSEGRPAFRRILLSRMKFIGDIVLTTPAIQSVRRAYPDAYIAYMGESEAVSLLLQNPNLDEVIPFDFSKPTLREQARVAMLLRSRRFDAVIDLFGNPRSALLTFLTGAPVRVGPDRKVRGLLYTVRVRDDGRPKTAVAFHNQYLTAAGIEPTVTQTEIFLTEREKQEGTNELMRVLGEAVAGRPVIGIHPGASWPAKRWLPERFGELANVLAERLHAGVVLTMGPNDGETIAAVTANSRMRIAVLPNLPLRRLAGVLAGCQVYISNDAGPMHIAAAMRTPTIGLFGPGEEDIWFPYPASGGHSALRKEVSCHPCHLDFCDRTGEGYMKCMRLLSVEDVFGAVCRALSLRA